MAMAFSLSPTAVALLVMQQPVVVDRQAEGSKSDRQAEGSKSTFINIEALCAAPPKALAHSPSQMPLSCLDASPSQRKLHKNGGGSGGGEW